MVTSVAVAVLGLATGAGGLGVGAAKTRTQREWGVFNEPESKSTVEQVLSGLNEIVDSAASAVVARDTVTQAAATVLGIGVDAAMAVDQAIAAARASYETS